MAFPKLSDALAQQAVDLHAEHGSALAAARALRIPNPTFEARLRVGRARGMTPGSGRANPDDLQSVRAQVKRLEAELKRHGNVAAELDIVKGVIGSLRRKVEELEIPQWAISMNKPAGSPGVPTLFVSDLHWGEVVYPSQIGNVNKYNIAIAHERMERLVERAIHLLGIISPKYDYPGIVVPLGGDMISGNIHDELTATNELNSMPAVLDLFGMLVRTITTLADKFGRVFLVCVSGNHGRDTRKIWTKDRHATSFDWLLYRFLAKHFENDKRVTFFIPDGPDAYYRVYNQRYLLTHGDQFRGGDGMIGALGPIIRGDHKKRSRNAQIDMEYDTLVMGHWHQDIFLRRLIVNGSLKGYDEYANSNNFGFEPPSQQLWLTHPREGITFRMPVYVGRRREMPKTNWVSVPK